MTKVVINNCYGGFSISKACAERMAELGSDAAAEIIETPMVEWYGGLPYDYDRHCPILVQAVEELGAAASGFCAELSIVEIGGDRYMIKEYDGTESVKEPKDINWIVV